MFKFSTVIGLFFPWIYVLYCKYVSTYVCLYVCLFVLTCLLYVTFFRNKSPYKKSMYINKTKNNNKYKNVYLHTHIIGTPVPTIGALEKAPRRDVISLIDGACWNESNTLSTLSWRTRTLLLSCIGLHGRSVPSSPLLPWCSGTLSLLIVAWLCRRCRRCHGRL